MANNQLLASDNFASGSLAAGWTLADGLSNTSAILVGTPNVAQPRSTSDTDGQVWTGLVWTSDQISEIVVQTCLAEAGTFLQCVVRWQQTAVSGYMLRFTNGTFTVNRVDAGSVTQLATVAGSISSGDILTLSAAGSCISAYQNGNRILYVGDATYVGGYPGFYSSSSVNVADVQVSLWRGYNAIQQDGIWQKQGIVLAPAAADLTSSGIGVYEGNAIFDSNPQILVGPNVYKLWFSAGPLTSSSVYYAESPDLVNWTRHSGAVLASMVTPTVIKVGSTYHLYCQAAASPGSGDTQHFTSPDGITWTLQSASVFSNSAYPLKPIAIVGGTWYALWGSLGVSAFPTVNLATSTDGVTWVAYGSNPVISGAYPFACVANVGSTYYVWMQRGPSAAQNSASADLFDPNESVRYSTTDFIHWSAPVASVHHSQMFESLNTPVSDAEAVGGNAPTAVFNIGGKATMLVNVSQGDSVGPQVAQFSVATAPAPIASIVLFNENAVQQTAVDNFNRGAGPIGANWSSVGAFGTLKIVSGNLVEPSATATDSFMVYSGSSFSSSLYSEITVAASTSGGNISPCIANVSGTEIYFTNIGDAAGSQGYQAQIAYYNGSGNLDLTPAVGMTIEVGDVLRLTLVQNGTTNVLSLFQNGSLISQGVHYVQPTGLLPGIYLREASTGEKQVSLWAGGNANTIPTYRSLGSNMPQPLQVFSNGGQSYIVIDNGAAGVISTSFSDWDGITDGVNFDNTVNGAIGSNGSTNPTANNQSVPDYIASGKSLTVTTGAVIQYKLPS